jgi:hypothetical protein
MQNFKFKLKVSKVNRKDDILKECSSKFGVYIWGVVDKNSNFSPIYIGQAGGMIKNEFHSSSTDLAKRLLKHTKFIDNYNILKVDNFDSKNSIIKSDKEVLKMLKKEFSVYAANFAYINFKWDDNLNRVVGGKNNIKNEKITNSNLQKSLNHISTNFGFKYIEVPIDLLVIDGYNTSQIKRIILGLEKHVSNLYGNKGEKMIGMSLGKTEFIFELD